MFKKCLSLVLSLLMTLGVMAIMPISVYAGEADVAETGAAYVTDAISKECSYRLGSTDYHVSYHVPQINLNSADAKAINQEIMNAYRNKTTRPAGTVLNGIDFTLSIGYTSYVKNNVLSVHITCTEFEIHYTTYRDYNINISTGKRLSNSQFASAAGKSYATLQAGVKAAIRKIVDPKKESGVYQYNPDMYTKSLSQANIDEATFYYDKKGQICASFKYYAPIQASVYYSTVVLAKSTLATPVIAKRQNTAGGVKLTWNAVAGAAKYRVFLKTASGWQKLADTTGLSYTHTAAKSGYTYTYTVRCVSADGKSATSGYNTTGWKVTFYAAPKIKSLVNKINGVQITWDKVGGASKYSVFVKNGSSWQRLGNTTGTTYLHQAVNSGVKYTYTVRCISSDGKKYLSAYNTTGRSCTFIAAPVISKRQILTDGIKLTWSAVKGAAKYRVFIKNGSSWKKLADTAALEYTYKGVVSGETYTFTVRCLNAAGTKFTGAANPTGWKAKFIAAPRVTGITSTASGVKLVWNKVAGAVKYRVFVKNGSSWKKLGDTAGTAFIDRNVASGSRYYYTVRCISADGKAYQSAYNTTGWSIVFKNPINWSSMYYRYIIDNNLSIDTGDQYNTKLTISGDIPLALHDMDMNGIPELIIGCPGARLGLGIFTIYGGKVIYTGMLGGKSIEYSDNRAYHGIFRWDSVMAGMEGSVSYSTISGGKLIHQSVQSYRYDQTTHKKTETIYNTTLNDIYNAGTNNLSLYYWRDIESKGWNSFVSFYGY